MGIFVPSVLWGLCTSALGWIIIGYKTRSLGKITMHLCCDMRPEHITGSLHTLFWHWTLYYMFGFPSIALQILSLTHPIGFRTTTGTFDILRGPPSKSPRNRQAVLYSRGSLPLKFAGNVAGSSTSKYTCGRRYLVSPVCWLRWKYTHRRYLEEADYIQYY